ncbi:Integration host factor subunit beta [Candidatus Gullanella endobia]|uniref:Integration host factor subunit beta n=1 Tax=Candidatus Gullanella endobia TaxID=1070130 RepID=A0A143WRH1_9ENTR|nr:integration host factor subunit beta [Candidatus Gullanella endobia]CUX96273.1 Integration host factor subunit beta [Candidatus Gullanella endobia]
MTKSELIKKIATHCVHIRLKVINSAVQEILEHMALTLTSGERIEIRGFGSFSTHYRAPRIGRNPKTGDIVKLEGRYVLHFKPGRELRNRANINN